MKMNVIIAFFCLIKIKKKYLIILKKNIYLRDFKYA